MITPYRIRLPLIQVMIDEHVVIMRALGVLNAVAMSMSKKHAPPVSDLKLLMRFFKEYADRIHHHSEEDILFVALEKRRSRTMRRMVEKLGTQHVIGRMLVAQMSEALTGAKTYRRGWCKQFIENAVAYHALLSVHICDEDHIFFPAADKALVRMAFRGRPRLPEKEIQNKIRLESGITRLARLYLGTP